MNLGTESDGEFHRRSRPRTTLATDVDHNQPTLVAMPVSVAHGAIDLGPPDFGARGVLSRFGQTAAKVLVATAADCHSKPGEYSLKPDYSLLIAQ